jgi:pyruvate/2-oxoglutarate dehydrogenase complex dihydrolipoamide acyltransferase (E2) component
LTTLSGDAVVAPKKKYGMLPVLTVLFLISYGLMTMLIVEQGSTIQSQRALIMNLFSDSTELSALKIKAGNEKNQAEAQRRAKTQAKNQSPSSEPSSDPAQNPSSQTQSNQAPSNQAPSDHAATQQRAQNQARKAAQPQIQRPTRPASDLVDERRALVSI